MSDQDGSPSGRERVSAVVKWYNPVKGFGFVKMGESAPDAFLHASVLNAAGHRDAPDGAPIDCEVEQGPRGLQVAIVHGIDAPAAPPETDEDGPAIEGTVKFFDAAKGFGFIMPDDGGRDVFVSGRILQRHGLRVLEPEQRVRVVTRMGDKGPMAASIEPI